MMYDMQDFMPIEELLAELGERPGTKWCTDPIAGLQFYKYDKPDPLTGEPLRPRPYERLQLIRRPDNPEHGNAIEVWMRNAQHRLGHVSWELADDLAPGMDAGRDLRAYALNEGDGEAWSVRMVLVGAAVTEERQAQSVRIRQEREDSAAYWAFREGEWNTEGTRREVAQSRKARADDTIWRRDRINRLKDAVSVLAPLTDAPEALPEGHDLPPPEKGSAYTWWDQVPPSLGTKKQWRDRGRTIKAKTEPWATISYGHRYKGRVSYSLYAFEQTRKVATTASTIRSILEPLERRLAHVEDDVVVL